MLPNHDLFDRNATVGAGPDEMVTEVGYRFWQNRTPVHATELYTRRFEEIIAKHHPSSPIFVLLSWSAPHHPFQPQTQREVDVALRSRPAGWYSSCAWQTEQFGAGACDTKAA